MSMKNKTYGTAEQGYQITYREGETNHCPGCGQSQWIIGLSTAECAFCSTAIVIASSHSAGSGMIRTRGKCDAIAPLAA